MTQDTETSIKAPHARYRWAEPSPISEMRVETIAGDRVRCRLSPGQGLDAGTLAHVPEAMRAAGFEHVYADVMDGTNILVVDRLKNADKILEFLDKNQLIIGDPTIEHAISEQVTHGVIGRALNTIKGDTIKWSGRIGLLGHASFFTIGAIRGETQTMLGASGAINPVILSVYGNGKSDIDFNQMMDKMVDYFRVEGLDLPDHEIRRQKTTFLSSINDLLATYPLQIGHGLGCIGAYANVASGLSEFRKGQKSSLGLALTGATSLLGNLVVMFVPETKRDKNDETTAMESLKYGLTHIPDGVQFAATQPHRVPGQMWQFVKDSPLRANGLLNATDNISMFFHAVGKVRHQRLNPSKFPGIRGQLDNATPYMWLTTAFSWGMATFLSAISSKNRDAAFLQDDMYEPMYAAAAKFLVQMPQSDRKDTLRRMANFLSAQEEVQDGDISAEKIVSEIEQRINTLECSPWLNRLESCNSAKAAPTLQIA